MVDLKDGPRLVIDHMIMYQLLNSEGFWDTLPPLADRREEGEAVAKKALQIAMGKACAGCTSIRSALLPLHNRVWAEVADMRATAPESVGPLVEFIARKRGYRPVPIIVYYVGEDGGTVELRL